MKSIELDYSKQCADEPTKGHNRWHPDIPPALEVAPGEEVVLQTRNAIDGGVVPTSRPEDLRNINLGLVHPLTGPVYVQGAEPGDLLEVSILNIEPASWGFTTVIPGFGFLRDVFLDPYVVHWSIQDGYAESPQLPGVRVPGAPFMGTIGVAPSRQLRQEILLREDELRRRGGAVLGPDPQGPVPANEPLASEGLRTVPPRENGGNMDIKQLTAGTRLLLPVFTEGALFSAGDAHYAQGDSECCGTAIEMGQHSACQLPGVEGCCPTAQLKISHLREGRLLRQPGDGGAQAFPGVHRHVYLRKRGERVRECHPGGTQRIVDYGPAPHGKGLVQGTGVLHLQCSGGLEAQRDRGPCPNFVVSAFLPLDIFV